MSRTKKIKEGKGKLETALDNSPINYFSDLFIVAMVVGWIVVLLIMVVFAGYSTLRLEDSSMWSDVANLVASPLSCGGAIWMIKNSVQHAIANKQGKQCPQDFPAVNAGEDFDGFEKPMEFSEDEDSGENEDSEEAVG